MKWSVRVLAGLVVMVGVLAGVERYAAESGEVVVLHARDAEGGTVPTRLWVVDHEGRAYLRVGADGSGWYERLMAAPQVALQRAGVRSDYLAVPDPTASDVVNALMRSKYGWRDVVIGAMVGGRDGSIPIRLDPVAAHPLAGNPASETGSPAMRE